MPKSKVTRRWDQGYVDSRPAEDLRDGEMDLATGVVYKPGNAREAFKVDGRSEHGDTLQAEAVDGIALCQFDAGGTDSLVAISNSNLYLDASVNGTFDGGTTIAGIDTLSAAHANNNWYLGMRAANRVLQSDGTLRSMGLNPAIEQLTLTVNKDSDTTGPVRPTSHTNVAGTFSNSANVWDTGTDALDTFGFATVNSTVTSLITTFEGFAADPSPPADRFLRIVWSLDDGPLGKGGQIGLQWRDITIQIEMNETASPGPGTWVTVLLLNISGSGTADPYYGKQTTTAALGSGDLGTPADNFRVRTTMTYNDGSLQSNLKIYDIQVIGDPESTVVQDIVNLTYTYTEFDESTGLESVPAEPVSTGAQTDVLSIELGFPSAALNSTTTHWRVYRTDDGGSEGNLALIATVDVSESVYPDLFEIATSDQPAQVIDVVTIISAGAVTTYFRNYPPPALRRVTYYKGSLVGLTDDNLRAMFYSEPGFPEYWPETNVVETFNLPQHDELVDLAEVGGSLVVAGKDYMLRMDDLPQVIGSEFIASEVVTIRGAPGCVGDYAMTTVSYRGFGHVAWISAEDGILVTDGHRYESISDDLDWSKFEGMDKSGWVLEWLPTLNSLLFAYEDPNTGSGLNDRFYLLSLDKAHVKSEGRAKISGPHYGRIGCTTVGQISGTTKIFSGFSQGSIDPNAGKVYLEFDSAVGVDDSESYLGSGNGDQLRLEVQDGYRYGPGLSAYSVVDGFLRFTSFGAGQTATLTYTTRRDESEFENATAVTVDMAITDTDFKSIREQIEISDQGEAHKIHFLHTGDTGGNAGSLIEFILNIIVQGDEGEVGV